MSLGTAGGYSGSEAVNAEVDDYDGDTYYAVVGYEVDTECCSVGLKGTFSAGLRNGFPGHETNKNLTRSWFRFLGEQTKFHPAIGGRTIPCFNSYDKAATFLDGVQDENGADPLVNLNLLKLTTAGRDFIKRTFGR